MPLKIPNKSLEDIDEDEVSGDSEADKIKKLKKIHDEEEAEKEKKERKNLGGKKLTAKKR